MLVPSLMLVLIALTGIAIDLTLLHLSHRSLHRAVSAAADDAASMIDERHLQLSGELRIDEQRATTVAMARMGIADTPGRIDAVTVSFGPGGDTVTVAVDAEVDHIVLRAAPGIGATEQLVVRAASRLHR